MKWIDAQDWAKNFPDYVLLASNDKLNSIDRGSVVQLYNDEQKSHWVVVDRIVDDKIKGFVFTNKSQYGDTVFFEKKNIFNVYEM